MYLPNCIATKINKCVTIDVASDYCIVSFKLNPNFLQLFYHFLLCWLNFRFLKIVFVHFTIIYFNAWSVQQDYIGDIDSFRNTMDKDIIEVICFSGKFCIKDDLDFSHLVNDVSQPNF